MECFYWGVSGVAELEDIANDANGHNRAVLIELKRLHNLPNKEDHPPQTICKHPATSALIYLAVGIALVLTELNDG